METNTVVLLGMMSRLLTQFLELSNRIDNEDDMREPSVKIKQDLPELKYYDLKENELSGIAMRTLLAGALDRA